MVTRWPSEPPPHTVVWHYIAGLLTGLALTRAEIGKRLSRRGPAVRLQQRNRPEAAPARATASITALIEALRGQR